MKKIVLLLGFLFSLSLVSFIFLSQKFDVDCSYTIKEPTSKYVQDFNDGRGPVYVYSGGQSIKWCEPFVLILLPVIPILFFSLLTYRMKDEVFRAWWSFARRWVVVIVGATLLLMNASGGGTLGMDRDFTAFVLIILYAILILVSVSRIFRAYFTEKLREKGASPERLAKIKIYAHILTAVLIVVFLLLFSIWT